MTRADKIACWGLLAGAILGPLVYDLGVTYRGDGYADVRVNVAAPSPVREIQYSCMGRKAQLAEARELLEYGYIEMPEAAGSNPPTLSVSTGNTRSGIGWTTNRFYQHKFVVMVVELENGSRWAVEAELPDVRKTHELTVSIPGPNTRQITVPKPKKP